MNSVRVYERAGRSDNYKTKAGTQIQHTNNIHTQKRKRNAKIKQSKTTHITILSKRQYKLSTGTQGTQALNHEKM